MVYSLINNLVKLNIEKGLISARDEIYTRNVLLHLLKEDDYKDEEVASLDLDVYDTLDKLCDLAVEKGIIEDTLSYRDRFSSELMNVFLPLPSQVEDKFAALYKEDPKKATDYFYKLSQDSNYVKMARINKNIHFTGDSPYGEIDITINLSKPEKDPKDIAAQKNMVATSYPKCLLCKENEGYYGTATHPDRINHRTIGLSFNNKGWRMQYSPYLYYNEHCILLLDKHEPMQISHETFYNLLGFVEKFPHYFIGSNADLPIVGGSILAHEHYQGGHYEFPMHRAEVIESFTIASHPNVTCSILNWPLSTITIEGDKIEDVAEAANYVFKQWKEYSDEEADILAYTDGARHNTVTPVARTKNGKFILDVVLRNNRTTDEHPLGIFHPHNDVQHIKKENIGLIEVMGLAILPARLKAELADIKTYILNPTEENFKKVAPNHREWTTELKESYNSDNIDTYVENAVTKKFTRVLEDAGVFKITPESLEHFKKFIATL